MIEDELLPSHALVDAISHMADSNHLTWLPPSRCTKRDTELKVAGKEKDQVLKVLDNAVTLQAQEVKLTAECSTPLTLQWCLQRRGLAFDMNNIIAWETHEKWTSFLMQSLTREVPPGYATISINQLLRADSELFLLMSKEISSVKADSTGRLQADEAMNRLKTDPRITMYLLPLPKSAPWTTPPGSHHVEAAPAPSSSKRTKTRTPPPKVKGLMAPVKTDGLPEELKACKHLTAHDGRRLCWGFNCEGCSLETDHKNPAACRKGVHACAVCRKPGHGARTCWHRPNNKGKGKGKATGAAKE